MSERLICGYHCTAKPVSFGRGQSAVHTAAYNARTQLEHEREDKLTKDYSKHEGELLFSGIFAPKDAPAWAHDRNELWNRAEAAERQKVNGQPARNMIVAFPHELNQQQREWMVTDFAREQFARKGMVADVAMHGPDAHGDQRNFHAHILLTMRRIDGQEFARTKERDWNSKGQLAAWREQWAEKGAQALERAGYPLEAERWRHGHETLETQRTAAVARGDTAFAESLAREPTGHKGPKLSAMDRRGETSDRLDELREVLDRNDIRVEIGGIDREIAELERQLTAEREAEEKKRQQTAPGVGLEWTDRAGMAPQQRSALDWAKDRAPPAAQDVAAFLNKVAQYKRQPQTRTEDRDRQNPGGKTPDELARAKQEGNTLDPRAAEEQAGREKRSRAGEAVAAFLADPEERKRQQRERLAEQEKKKREEKDRPPAERSQGRERERD